MTKQDKLLKKLISKSKTFTYDNLKSLLRNFGYDEIKIGKTSGSRVAFFNENDKHLIRLHKPNPGNELKRYQIEYIIEELKNKGII